METMRYSETRKTSKGPVIAFFTFVILGCAFIAFGIYIEEGNSLFGKGSIVNGLVDIYENVDIYNSDVDDTIQTSVDLSNADYKIADKTVSDKSNKKIKSNITVPVISIGSDELTEVNEKISNEYTTRYNSFKDTLAKAENNYTYKVTYNAYENVIGNKKILSVTIWQRTIDDSSKSNVFDKIDTYNINILNKNEVKVGEVAKDILGTNYKSKIATTVKEYVVKNCGIDEATFIYAMSGMENFYVKNGILHIIINSDELVDKKYGVLDIKVE